jgi:hypothetical protein
MDDNTSQVNMAAASPDGAPPGTAVQVATSTASLFGETKPSSGSSNPVTPSITPKFHPHSLITLLVGPDEDKLVVYETYLSQDSAFFKAALKKQWTEGQTRIIKLPEELLEPMQHYIEHLYGGKLPTHNLTAETTSKIETEPYDMLAQLYVLGERVLNAKYQNAVTREILRLSKLSYGPQATCWYPGASTINILYQGTTSHSPIRRMMVDFGVYSGSQSWFKETRDPGYYFDFSRALIQKVVDQKTVCDFRGTCMKAKD